MNTIAPQFTEAKYGEHISFAVHADVDNTGLSITFEQPDGAVSRSSVEYHPAGDYTKSVGLYAPNWPAGPAHGTAEIVQVSRKGKGGKLRTTVLATYEFEVAA